MKDCDDGMVVPAGSDHIKLYSKLVINLPLVIYETLYIEMCLSKQNEDYGMAFQKNSPLVIDVSNAIQNSKALSHSPKSSISTSSWHSTLSVAGVFAVNQ